MRRGRRHRGAVDRHHVLRTGREGDEAIHFGAQRHVAARGADRRQHVDRVAVDDRNIHEQVERRWRLGRGQTELAQTRREVVGAVVVIGRAAEQPVTPAVAGRDQRVVDAARIVLGGGGGWGGGGGGGGVAGLRGGAAYGDE